MEPHDTVRRYADLWASNDIAGLQRTSRQLDEIEDVLAGTTFGAIVARERVGGGDDARIIRRVFLYTVRDAKLDECWLYDEDQRAIDELWSSPAATPEQSPP